MTRRHDGNTETTQRRQARRALRKVIEAEARQECEDLLAVRFGSQGLTLCSHCVLAEHWLTRWAMPLAFRMQGKYTHCVTEVLDGSGAVAITLEPDEMLRLRGLL